MKKNGFTLIELLVVLVILSIISTFAYSSYQNVIIKIRRFDAQTELTKVQMLQSSYHIIHPSYISDIELIHFPIENDFYSFSLVSASTHRYLIKAVAKTNNTQNNDENLCKTLFIDQDNIKTSDGYTDNASCWDH